jgi:MinD-like ATPase involved in chromosome partitioning or flagellar assembly
MRVGFHSYKGGVGRTKIMVGTAALMAASGYRIGLIDFDLDASGLVSILGDQDMKFGQKELLYILQKLQKSDLSRALDSLIDRSDLVAERLGTHPEENGGVLKYIPTVSDPELSDRIKFGPRIRSLVDELFDYLLEHGGIDVLFIDMKPGYSQSASLVLPLCQRAVVVTRLDDQNISGLSRSLKKMMKGQINLDPILVANMLPSEQEAEIAKRISRLEEVTGHSVDVRINYEPDAVFDNDFSSLADKDSSLGLGLKAVVKMLEHPDDEDKGE